MTSDSTLVEIRSHTEHDQLNLHINCSVKKLEVMNFYHTDKVDTIYLILDEEYNLHVVQNVPKLKVLNVLHNVVDLQITDESNSGCAQCKVKRLLSEHWEDVQFDSNGASVLTTKNVKAPIDSVTPTLKNTLKSCETRLKYLENALTKKRLLRAAALIEENSVKDITKHLHKIYSHSFYLHSRLVVAVKVVNESEFPVEDLKLAAYSDSKLSFLQPLRNNKLNGKETTILVGVCDGSAPLQRFTLAIQYKANDTAFYLPLGAPSMVTGNVHQHLKFIGVDDCIRVLSLASYRTVQISWKLAFSTSVQQKLQESLMLTPILNDKDTAVSSCGNPDMPGMLVIEHHNKNKAVICYRDVSQFEILKCLIFQLPVSIRKGLEGNKALNVFSIPNDVAFIKSKKQICKKSIPLQAYLQVLQELVHKMSAFQR